MKAHLKHEIMVILFAFKCSDQAESGLYITYLKQLDEVVCNLPRKQFLILI